MYVSMYGIQVRCYIDVAEHRAQTHRLVAEGKQFQLFTSLPPWWMQMTMF